jgi:hypothetical protein
LVKGKGPIGSNVNKGYEIYICLDGDDVNSAMYILIHELAHMSVPEYDHSDHFWKNFDELRYFAEGLGVYVETGTRKYCGDQINESVTQKDTALQNRTKLQQSGLLLPAQ